MLIAGTDEVGRGPLAGPVTAAAVVFPEGYSNSEIRDSKLLSPKKRQALVPIIQRDAIAYAIVCVGHRRIDTINILEASLQAMALAVSRVSKKCQLDLVRVDGNVRVPTSFAQETIVGGDRKFVEISAASILAKVYRDHLMEVLDKKYPGYGFAQHAGYPTSEHRAALLRLGRSPIHRRTFSGVKELSERIVSAGRSVQTARKSLFESAQISQISGTNQ